MEGLDSPPGCGERDRESLLLLGARGHLEPAVELLDLPLELRAVDERRREDPVPSIDMEVELGATTAPAG